VPSLITIGLTEADLFSKAGGTTPENRKELIAYVLISKSRPLFCELVVQEWDQAVMNYFAALY